MAGDLNKFASRMRYWCDEANLGYDQGQRWDIRPGGECDCSSLVYYALWEAGFLPTKPTWGNTETLSAELTKRGWKRIAPYPQTTPKVGDILLNDEHHVAVCTAPGMMSYASIDERGKTSGGQSGDQTDRETRTVSGFWYTRGWDCILRYGGSQSATQTTTTTGGFKVYGFPLVKNGSKGDAVKMCQAALNVRMGAGLQTDGVCGSKTEAAIKKWQESHGLEPDKQCGPKTWQSLLGA